MKRGIGMKKQTFKTLIKKDHMLGDNNYVYGRIFGIAEMLCDIVGEIIECVDKNGDTHFVREYNGSFINRPTYGDLYLSMECTQEQYEKFKSYIEDIYPDLCEFYFEYEN